MIVKIGLDEINRFFLLKSFYRKTDSEQMVSTLGRQGPSHPVARIEELELICPTGSPKASSRPWFMNSLSSIDLLDMYHEI